VTQILGKKDLEGIYIHAVILMTAPDSQVDAHGSSDENYITYLNQKCLTYFKGKSHIDSNRWLSDIRALHSYIEQAIVGKTHAISTPTCYRDWQIEEELGEVENKYKEYRAQHILLGKRGGVTRLRIYQIDAYEDQATRDKQRQIISNAYRSVAHMPGHPNILKVQEFFSNEAEEGLNREQIALLHQR
jgi:hypothetical protein